MSDKAEVGQEFLFHYGVKGMKWGKSGGTASINGPSTAKLKKSVSTVSFKKKDPSPSEVSAQSTLSRRGKTKIKTQGGGREQASGDAIKTATLKQKLKKSGTDALSNQELQELSNRMNLETQVSRLNSQQTTGGKKFVKDLVKEGGQTQVKRVANTQATKLVDVAIKK